MEYVTVFRKKPIPPEVMWNEPKTRKRKSSSPDEEGTKKKKQKIETITVADLEALISSTPPEQIIQ